MERNQYSLSHLAHNAGHIGRIKCLSVIPVEAGASLQLSLNGIVRLAPPRKEIVSDCQLDIVAFFVPYRIIWGQAFIDFLMGGPGGAAFSPTPIPVPAQYRYAPYLCANTVGANINTALLEGYNRIFYNYWAVPSYPFSGDSNGTIPSNNFTYFPTTDADGENCRQFGRLAARLPHVLNGGNTVNAVGALAGFGAQSLVDADQQVPINTGAGYFNLTDMANIASRYKSKIGSAWFTHFYQDMIQEKYGTHVGPDADPRNLRPHLLMRETRMLSGHDIDGTDDATLGSFQGKTLEQAVFSMPRKLFAEHGMVFLMACARYPLVHVDEIHPLIKQANGFTYDQISGEAERYAALAPETWDPSPWLCNGSTYAPNANVKQPYGQHYRYQNNYVHPNFKTIPGYPFSNWDGTTLQKWYYYMDEEYEDTFTTPQIGHWQMQAMLNVQKFSLIPGVAGSYFAGSN